MKRLLCWLLVACSLFFSPALHGEEKQVDYTRDIKPLLTAHCFKCHGPDEQESDLRLDTAKLLFEGGISGTSAVPGKGAESLLIQVLRGTSDDVSRMPPEDEAKAFTDEQIALIERWIDQGAKFPADEKPIASKTVRTTHWSFQPIVRSPLPPVKNRDWVRNAIDAFVLAKLEKQNIAPSPEADRATLIRRLSLDLRGIQPTIPEVDAFVTDTRGDAYEQLVDRLLASPRYGERWGRHWLDQARYADSDGYTNDVPRVIWRYRDWVIDAVNRDQPFDQFVVDQVAGDMLPGATTQQIVATGFHRNTQRNREGGSDFEQYRVEAVIDRVSTTGVVFLGLTLGCARCHSHKYDPVSQQEFYQIFAFLNNQDEPTQTVTLDGIDTAPLAAASKERAEAEKALREFDAKLPEDIKKLLAIAEKKRTAVQNEMLTMKLEELKTPRKPLADRVSLSKKQEQGLLKQTTTTTLVMRERSQPRESYIHIRGDFLRKGKVVQPSVPAALPALPADVKNPSRLNFARWLVSPDHPLTPRVTVNRFWQYFFGRGIVETENDFGKQGTPPSHPQLLDWLAGELVDGGWSLKAIHRTIVTSATYRQSSHVRADLHDVDPNNRLLARQNRVRLEAESIRDTALAAAGLLSGKMKGPSVYPPQPDGVMKMTRNPNRKWNVSTGEDRYRRGMYTYFWRSTPHPFLKLFNAPESNATCTRRDRSNTPLQALTLLNDEAFIEAAQVLAVRVLREAPSADRYKQLEFAFRQVLSRRPSAEEKAALRQLLDTEMTDSPEAEKAHRFAPTDSLPEEIDDNTLAAWTSVARALLNLDEFITRE